MTKRVTVLWQDTETVDGRKLKYLQEIKANTRLPVMRNVWLSASDKTAEELSESNPDNDPVFGIMHSFEWDQDEKRLTCIVEPELDEGFVLGADVSGGVHREGAISGGKLIGAQIIPAADNVWVEIEE